MFTLYFLNGWYFCFTVFGVDFIADFAEDFCRGFAFMMFFSGKPSWFYLSCISCFCPCPSIEGNAIQKFLQLHQSVFYAFAEFFWLTASTSKLPHIDGSSKNNRQLISEATCSVSTLSFGPRSPYHFARLWCLVGCLSPWCLLRYALRWATQCHVAPKRNQLFLLPFYFFSFIIFIVLRDCTSAPCARVWATIIKIPPSGTKPLLQFRGASP